MQKVEPSNNSNFFKSLNMTRYIDYLKNLLYKESYIPTLNITINIPTTDNDSKFPRTLVSVIAKNIDGWANIKNENDIIIESIKGALTNNIYFITNISSNKKIILRVYGKGVDKLLNREKELDFLKMLSKVNIGPQLLLIFNNGRFEQFFESVNLTKEEMKDEEISRKIAAYMFKLHNVVTIFPPDNIENIVPEVWSKIDQWFQLAWDIINSGSSDSSNNVNIERFDLELLKKEIKELKSILQMVDSPIVFAHNDCQYGNILRLTDGSNQLAIIDLEYSGWNHRGFDIGNHLCEWAFDYHSTEPHVAHLDWYPNEQQQRCYLNNHDSEGSNNGNDAADGLSRKNILEHHPIFFNADIRGLTDKLSQSQHDSTRSPAEQQRYLNISLDWNKPVDTALLHSVAVRTREIERELLPLPIISAHTNSSLPNSSNSFARLYNLKSHQCTHSTDRPYRCLICELAFARNHDLKRHQKIHDKIGCSQTSQTKSKKSQHMSNDIIRIK
nr:14283_t:CDS:2 [Entrophospora candida]CAG8565274.1 11941_t:CDS:2 [Entrophospora candida]